VLLTRQSIDADLKDMEFLEVTLYLHLQVRSHAEMASIDNSRLPIAGHEKSTITHGD
jgi:hypothetical protein